MGAGDCGAISAKVSADNREGLRKKRLQKNTAGFLFAVFL
jgi:hypothetical protein